MGHAAEVPTDQYHEPPEELSPELRTSARVIASLQEEAEAIGWYEQRISLELVALSERAEEAGEDVAE